MALTKRGSSKSLMPCEDQQQERAAALASLCQAFPSCPEPDVRRFLVARKYDLAKAEPFLRDDLKWRAEYKPEQITQERLQRSLRSGCWRALPPIQREGRTVAVLWVQVGLWNPEEYDLEEYVAMVVYFLERLAQVGETFVVIFDMEGWRLSHGNQLRKVHGLITTLQDHYPERLRASLLTRAPAIFRWPWMLIKPWIDPVTAAKVSFLPKEPHAETAALLEHVDAAGLPTPYGGELEPDGLPVPGFAGEPTITILSK